MTRREKRSSRLESRIILSHIRLAKLYVKNGDFDQAEDHHVKSIAAKPTCHALFHYGQFLNHRRCAATDALSLYDKALAVDGYYVPALLAKAKLLGGKGEVDSAQFQLLFLAMACCKASPQYAHYMSDVLSSLGFLCLPFPEWRARSLDYFQQTLKVDKANFGALHGLALHSEFCANQPATTFLLYEKALAVAPAHVGCLRGLGRSLKRLGEKSMAQEAFELALAADPDNSATMKALARLLDEQLGDAPHDKELYEQEVASLEVWNYVEARTVLVDDAGYSQLFQCRPKE